MASETPEFRANLQEGRRRAQALITTTALAQTEEEYSAASDQLIREIWDSNQEQFLGALGSLTWYVISFAERMAPLEGKDPMTMLQECFARVEKKFTGEGSG